MTFKQKKVFWVSLKDESHDTHKIHLNFVFHVNDIYEHNETVHLD